jgi:hypothetical protein
MSGHPGVLGDDDLVEVIQRLIELERRSTLETYCEQGRYILEHCYRGSMKRFRSLNGKKTDSIKRMAARVDCPYSESKLYDSVRVADACERLPHLKAHPALKCSHFIKVANLSDEDQAAFLQRAASGRWTVRQLEDEIGSFKRERGERRGAPRATAVRKAITGLRRCERSLAAFEQSIGGFPDVTAESARDVTAALDAMQALLTKARARADEWLLAASVTCAVKTGSIVPVSQIRWTRGAAREEARVIEAVGEAT